MRPHVRLQLTITACFSLVIHQPVSAGVIEDGKAYANSAMFWKSSSLEKLDFAEVFPKPIYKKSYFGLVITGVTVVAAGAFSYFTAGAGAPAAAAGTSAVATWVAGGGAGSYMAGLSTIGGWFGGNAMVGAAVLNGISYGVGVGGATTAVGKAGLMASVAAMTLDGVALIEKPETKNLAFRVRLVLPRDLGSKATRELVQELTDLDEKMQNADGKGDSVSYEIYAKQKSQVVTKGMLLVKQAVTSQKSNEDYIVLGVFSKNVGDSESFEKLLKKVNVTTVKGTGYLDYLKGVASLEQGDAKSANIYLRKSLSANPYAIEAPLLLVNVLGQKQSFKKNETEILSIAENTKKSFSANKYDSSYSLVSMYYRIGTFYLLAKRYDSARKFYQLALDEVSTLQKYLGDKQVSNMVRIGIANALYGEGKTKESEDLFLTIVGSAEDEKTRLFYKNQYAGAIK